MTPPSISPTSSTRTTATARPQPERTRWDRRSRRAEASYLAQARTQLSPRSARIASRRPA